VEGAISLHEISDRPRSFNCAALAFGVKTWNHVNWEVAMAAMEKIDWSECPLVEVKPEVQSGAPVLRGTRMPANAIVDNFDYGVSAAEIAEQFEIPPEKVEAILTYAQSHRFAHPL
jgi:uncharacterized protein (DUF433 family)